MKSVFRLLRLLSVALLGIFLAGCLLKRTNVSTREFVLTPIATNQPPSAGTEHLSVGIGFLKMPSYLLRSSMAVRNGANEIQYLEDAQWGERLDECFQQTLAADLSRLLPSDRVYLTDWARDQVMVTVFITVQQFDLDTHGQGTLIAQWRIGAPGSDLPLKTGHTRLERTGASPRGKPEVIAATLSDLAAEFSRELAPAIREAAAEKHARAD